MNRFTLGERVYDNEFGSGVVVGFAEEPLVKIRYDKDRKDRHFLLHPDHIDATRGGLLLRSLDVLTGDGEGI